MDLFTDVILVFESVLWTYSCINLNRVILTLVQHTLHILIYVDPMLIFVGKVRTTVNKKKSNMHFSSFEFASFF